MLSSHVSVLSIITLVQSEQGRCEGSINTKPMFSNKNLMSNTPIPLQTGPHVLSHSNPHL